MGGCIIKSTLRGQIALWAGIEGGAGVMMGHP